MEAKPWEQHNLVNNLIKIDSELSFRLHCMSTSIPFFFLVFLEFSGDGRFLFPLVISAILFPISSCSLFTVPLFVGGLLDLFLVGIIKHLVRRRRPIYNKGMHLTFAVDHWSFPSGHSSRVFFIASYLYLSSFDPRFGLSANFAVPVVCSWAALTSISRVLLGRHFVFDVVAGACLGVVESLLILYFWRNFIQN